MKNPMKKLGIAIFAMALMWSCGKDDGPAPPKDVNSVPVIATQEFSASEAISDAEVIGTVVATDADKDALTFSIKTNDNALFEITAGGGLSLATGKTLDFATKAQHTITVEVSDGTDIASANITIKVTKVDKGTGLADDPASFITTWKTNANNEDIVIVTNGAYTYNYAIDWGDGTVEQITSSDPQTHTYTTSGTYTVAIKGDFPAIINFTEIIAPTPDKLMSIEQWGTIEWEDMEYAFTDCENMVYNATDIPDLSKVTSLFGMFAYTSLFNGEIGSWDISHVTNLIGMFSEATAFNQDISGWDTSSVTDMSYMFAGAISFNGNISDWDTSNVTTMNSMFNLAEVFNADISGWDTSNVNSMNEMFAEAVSFNGNISDWNTSGVENMSAMFNGATAFNQDISGWDTGNVTTMASMFNGATVFDQNLGSWDISSLEDMQNMLDGCGMSTLNYSETIYGWYDQGNAPSNITFGAEGLSIDCDNADYWFALQVLLAKPWTINDDSPCH